MWTSGQAPPTPALAWVEWGLCDHGCPLTAPVCVEGTLPHALPADFRQAMPSFRYLRSAILACAVPRVHPGTLNLPVMSTRITTIRVCG